jgi:hypothetical protein
MNYTQSFEEFSKSLNTMDLALYAGIGLVLWVLFKDKLSPVQELLMSLFNQGKGLVNKNVSPIATVVNPVNSNEKLVSQDHFFDLIVSWKQTRDLAVASNCSDAVKSMDQMFPHLSPQSCSQSQGDSKK